MSAAVMTRRDPTTEQRIRELRESLARSDEFVERYREVDPEAAKAEQDYIEQLLAELEELER